LKKEKAVRSQDAEETAAGAQAAKAKTRNKAPQGENREKEEASKSL